MTISTAPTQAAPSASEWKNLLGVCAAIGEDLGFDPLWLRIAFAVPLIWHPAVVLAVYAAAGLVVLVSRVAYPAGKRSGANPCVATMPPPVIESLPSLATAG